MLGYYLASVQPPSMLVQSQETMYNLMLTELTAQCVEHSGIKCGFIGEVGSGWPLHGKPALIPLPLVNVYVSVRCALSSNHYFVCTHSNTMFLDLKVKCKCIRICLPSLMISLLYIKKRILFRNQNIQQSSI